MELTFKGVDISTEEKFVSYINSLNTAIMKQNAMNEIKQVIKQPFQLIKVSDNGDDTEAGLLAGAEFTAYLKSSLPVKAGSGC